MSTIKKIFIFLFLNCFCLSFSQVEKKRNSKIVFLDLKSRAVKEYTIDKDTTKARFSFYVKKYESKKERDKATKIYEERLKNRKTSGENPSEVRLPTFSLGFYSWGGKPEKLKSLNGVKFMTISQFQDSIYAATEPLILFIR